MSISTSIKKDELYSYENAPELSYIISEPPESVWIGAPIKKKLNNYNLYKSRIGGIPIYPPEWTDTDESLIAKRLPFLKDSKIINMKVGPICEICKTQMKFISQLFAPLGDWDRFFYVWACCEERCYEKNKSVEALQKRWKVYRLQMLYPGDDEEEIKVTEVKEEKKEDPKAFDESLQEWSLNNKTSDLDDELSQLLSKNSDSTLEQINTIQTKKIKSKKIKQSKGSLPSYELDIFEEPTEEDWIKENPKSQAAKIAKDFKLNNGELPNISDFTDDSEEAYEDGAVSLHVGLDPTNKINIEKEFLNFQIVLEKCPDQCIRWQWKGLPLWCTSKYLPGNLKENLQKFKGLLTKNEMINKSIPVCSKCKNPCAFEFQILPTIIYQLFEKNVEGFDFSSVFIFTCSSSCSPTKFDDVVLEECFVYVQPPIE